LYTMVLADTFKRWQVLLGNTDAQLLTGTDEHGMKVSNNQFLRGRAICRLKIDTKSSASGPNGHAKIL
jgi:hypothetical protein